MNERTITGCLNKCKFCTPTDLKTSNGKKIVLCEVHGNIAERFACDDHEMKGRYKYDTGKI